MATTRGSTARRPTAGSEESHHAASATCAATSSDKSGRVGSATIRTGGAPAPRSQEAKRPSAARRLARAAAAITDTSTVPRPRRGSSNTINTTAARADMRSEPGRSQVKPGSTSGTSIRRASGWQVIFARTVAHPTPDTSRGWLVGGWCGGGGALDRMTVISDWLSLSGIAEAFGMALCLTMLPCAGSRGRFGDDGIPMTVSFGSEADGAARASAGRTCARVVSAGRARARAAISYDKAAQIGIRHPRGGVPLFTVAPAPAQTFLWWSIDGGLGLVRRVRGGCEKRWRADSAVDELGVAPLESRNHHRRHRRRRLPHSRPPRAQTHHRPHAPHGWAGTLHHTQPAATVTGGMHLEMQRHACTGSGGGY
eukprot:scaffold18317_cov129-Isochrysis_galbana.AAC.2